MPQKERPNTRVLSRIEEIVSASAIQIDYRDPSTMLVVYMSLSIRDVNLSNQELN